MCPRSGVFVPGEHSERTLVPVFFPGEHSERTHPFGNHAFRFLRELGAPSLVDGSWLGPAIRLRSESVCSDFLFERGCV